MELEVDHTTDGDYDIVAPRGEVDLSNYTQLRDRIDELIVSGRTRVVLDLSETEFLDSTALGGLIAGRRRAYAAGGSFEVVCARPQLMKLFQITKLDLVFSVSPSLEHWREKAGLHR